MGICQKRYLKVKQTDFLKNNLENMKDIKHFYSLSPKWFQKLAQEIGSEAKDNKIITIPENLGVGNIYFVEVTPGISAIYKDYTLSKNTRIVKIKTEEEFFIFNYNLLKEEDLGHKKDFSIYSNHLEKVTETLVNERNFGFTLLVDKKVIRQLIKEMPDAQHLNKKLSDDKIYNDYIDIKSLMLIFSLEKKVINDSLFDYYISGISYKVLANFLDQRKN
ncbi:hypothetical protein FLA105535_01635 [Flavobacterium bizetiae]|nr:hypothetical protein FLA105535_01635 [Flavobacterium bizetiae]CAD5349928.1 hypothetical protein FLA105534_03915 [Flavobacterium bizetiae]